MRIALCNGGLGNQTFQYIFSRWIELASGEKCFLDDSAFWGKKVAHNGFEMKRVFPNAKIQLLSSVFDEDVWTYMLEQRSKGRSICQQIKDMGEDITLVAETDDYSFTGNVVAVPTNAFIPRLAQCKGNLYFHGYWINLYWLRSNFFEMLIDELQFAPLEERNNLGYAEQIRSCKSASIHIRRGDFVKLHWEKPPEMYKSAVEYTEKQVAGAEYFVFSDDLDWCRENMETLGLNMVKDRVHFVEGNTKENSFRDMQLMSLCKVNILVTSSSFSYLAALLNQNEDRIVINGTGREV